ncbi:uncharacterized protein HMPREF1541_09818 [Cyphellophora europaea CBS 101466]|uniref:RNA-dependent RNA polymerase n=1 Tax=Cyphellophora europaea (strain CBS 101466) TaxID=1220924 RepID=W2SAA6_CYPE1|nr:uncharacterized protein HMPREF1541_09818 [Cyphellophora europaea CBS 101466]ETN44943.1 hypothetical protein HMPREF1541_09818 [Cyphellophora europaea CBS 101466]
MDIFITSLDSRLNRESLHDSLKPFLLKSQIHIFDVRKAVGKTFATVTIADLQKAQAFLSQATANPSFFRSPSGRPAQFQISRKPIDEFRLKVLRKEEKDRHNVKAWQKKAIEAAATEAGTRERGLEFSTLMCGRWESKGKAVMFRPYFEAHPKGRLTRDGRTLVLRLEELAGNGYDLVIDHSTIASLAVSHEKSFSVLTITLFVAPRIIEDRMAAPDTDPLSYAFSALRMGPRPTTKFRVCTLPGLGQATFGSCLTYSLFFPTATVGLHNRIQSMTSRKIPIIVKSEGVLLPLVDYAGSVLRLNAQLDHLKCSYARRFQIEGLWRNGLLSPSEVLQLMPAMLELQSCSGESALTKALQRLNLQMSFLDATTDSTTRGLQEAADALRQPPTLLEDEGISSAARDEVSIYKVTVTPVGHYLSGPELIAANRVLRQYREHSEYFLRVYFADENEDRLEFDRDYSNDEIYRGRFLNVLRNGLEIGGRRFQFLGFSHSSLRSSTVWFMAPFVYQGTLLFARSLIGKLGDFSGIRCPAKCAARIGQAFSETTAAITVDQNVVWPIKDVEYSSYRFTDGCGTMSKSIWKMLKGKSRAPQPTSYQIRYQGAKGMLTLDTRLEGHLIHLRESMVKFTGSPSNELEICGTNAQPLPFKLNRQIIKILEDLKVPESTFLKLQDQDMERLRLSASSKSTAVNFVIHNLKESSSGLPRLLKNLNHIGVDVTEDEFLRDVLGALLQVQLREIKYRSRILVPDAKTLYGISDETDWLKEGEVFVTWQEDDRARHVCLNGRVAVTRSPALHPGDVQVVQAVAPPKDSALWNLRNCIAFSQKGTRDLPSMLSGGDLDGDLYNIIYDDALLPTLSSKPAAYISPPALDIGRPVTAEDMTAFFVDFMQNDQVGRIATLHQVLADCEPTGTFSQSCLALAELHSTAVDFSKSGIKVDVSKIPRAPRERPDFMCPSASAKVVKGIQRAQNDITPSLSGFLGKLYRAVNEDIFFEDLEDDTSSLSSKGPSGSVLRDILGWVQSHVDSDRLKEHRGMARDVREYYEAEVMDIMSSYSIRRHDQLTEKEVFIGTILGRSGAASRLQREQSDYMKNHFNRSLREIKDWMVRQFPEDDGGYEFMGLAAACLYVAVEEESRVDASLKSFGWFAAGLCVPDLVKEQEGSVFSL